MKKYITLFLVMLSSMFLITGCSNDNSSSDEKTPVNLKEAVGDVVNAKTNSDGKIVINKNKITDKVTYINYDVDGVIVGLLAVKDSKGEVKVDDTKAFSATYTKPDGFEDKTVTLTYTVTINSPLSTYINFQTAYGSTDGNNITSTVSNWTSDADLFENLPTLKWGMDDNNNTYGNFTSEEEYKTFIKNLNGTGVSEDWLNTDEVSVGELVTITFTATVS